MTFPSNFIWGAAAASYQIEGSTQGVDGCADSVWDLCCRKPGFVKYGDTGFTACDHYHRYEEDVALMREIGLNAYRLSIMWPRVLPDGVGKVNAKGLDFYDRLIDALCGAGVTPWVTLFHWDYPAALFERGGWQHEDSPLWFEEYAQVIVDSLSDRVSNWFTLNEPGCFIGLGHQAGSHAPGLKLTGRDLTQAWHNAMLAHGRAVRLIRRDSKLPHPRIGHAPCFHTTIPASESPADIKAARRAMFEMRHPHMFYATWNLDPLLRGAYPADAEAVWGSDMPVIRDGDMELIAQDLDFIGLNLYRSNVVRAGGDGEPETLEYPGAHPRTFMTWPVTPDALRWATRFLHEAYGKPILISETGMALNDWVALDGKVHDPQRIDFLTRYLRGLKQSIDEGVPVLGYVHWSIMDNFEWAEGYAPRFGLIHVDYATQQRTLKDSAYWYRDLIRSNGRTLEELQV